MTTSDVTKPGMTTSDVTKPGMTTSGRYPVFAITFGSVFAVVYLFVLNYSWQLFTYYPAVRQWTLFGHPASGPAMKWYGFLATSAVVAAVAGLIVSSIPERLLNRVWWSGLIWLLPIGCIIALGYLIVVVGD
jgi:hypothetical protein